MLFLQRRLGERIFIVHNATGDKFEIVATEAQVLRVDCPKAYIKIGIHAPPEYDIVREDVLHEMLSSPFSKHVISMTYLEKDYSCSRMILHELLLRKNNFPKLGYDDFCKGLIILSEKLEEINHFARIELTDDTVRLFDNNFLNISERKKEKYNEV